MEKHPKDRWGKLDSGVDHSRSDGAKEKEKRLLAEEDKEAWRERPSMEGGLSSHRRSFFFWRRRKPAYDRGEGIPGVQEHLSPLKREPLHDAPWPSREIPANMPKRKKKR